MLTFTSVTYIRFFSRIVRATGESDKNTSHHQDPVQRARSTVHARSEKDSGAALERTGGERQLFFA
jgi:hypothetical protein